MSAINCLVCFLPFNENVNVPKMLECGHSLCSICLGKVMESPSKKCPLCNCPIRKTSLSDYPTVYLALQLISEIKQQKPSGCKENIAKHKTGLLGLLEQCITELRDVCIDVANIPDEMKCECEVEGLRDELMKATAKAKQTYDRINLWESEFQKAICVADNQTTDPDSTVLSMNKFRSQEEYIEKIWSLLDEGKCVFAKENIEAETKYGRVERCSDFDNPRGIKIYSLSLSEVDRREATIVRMWRSEWVKKKYALVGDSRARCLNQSGLRNQPSLLRVSCQPGATTLTSIALAKILLGEHPDVDVLIMVAGHCDMTSLEVWSQDSSMRIMKAGATNVLNMSRMMAQATEDLQRERPGLLVVWTLPYVPDFTRYNRHRTRQSEVEYDPNEEETQNECLRYHRQVRHLAHCWWNVADVPPFHMGRLYPRNRGSRAVPKRWDSTPYLGETSDGLHPMGNTVYFFWQDVLSFAKNLLRGRNEGVVKMRHEPIMSLPQTSCAAEIEVIQASIDRRRTPVEIGEASRVVVSEMKNQYQEETNSRVTQGVSTVTHEETLKPFVRSVRKRKIETIVHDGILIEEEYAEESEMNSLVTSARKRIRKCLDDAVEECLEEIRPTLKGIAKRVVSANVADYIFDAI